MKFNNTHCVQAWLTTGVLVSVAFIAGCGGGAEIPELNETQYVEGAIGSVGDAAGGEDTFKKIFAGEVPENRAAYFSAKISIVGEPTIDGDTASATVKVTQGNAQDEGRGATKTEDVADGEVTWTLKKVGGEWKIDSAPLP